MRYYGAVKPTSDGPIAVSPPADEGDGPRQFERFDQLFRAVISVPKSAIDKEEAKWKRQKKRAKNKLGPIAPVSVNRV